MTLEMSGISLAVQLTAKHQGICGHQLNYKSQPQTIPLRWVTFCSQNIKHFLANTKLLVATSIREGMHHFHQSVRKKNYINHFLYSQITH